MYAGQPPGEAHTHAVPRSAVGPPAATLRRRRGDHTRSRVAPPDLHLCSLPRTPHTTLAPLYGARTAAQLPRLFSHSEPGIVLAPHATAILCAYSADGGTQGKVHGGCGQSLCTDAVWWGCSWGPGQLRQMMESQLAHRTGEYNESAPLHARTPRARSERQPKRFHPGCVDPCVRYLICAPHSPW